MNCQSRSMSFQRRFRPFDERAVPYVLWYMTIFVFCFTNTAIVTMSKLEVNSFIYSLSAVAKVANNFVSLASNFILMKSLQGRSYATCPLKFHTTDWKRFFAIWKHVQDKSCKNGWTMVGNSLPTQCVRADVFPRASSHGRCTKQIRNSYSPERRLGVRMWICSCQMLSAAVEALCDSDRNYQENY